MKCRVISIICWLGLPHSISSTYSCPCWFLCYPSFQEATTFWFCRTSCQRGKFLFTKIEFCTTFFSILWISEISKYPNSLLCLIFKNEFFYIFCLFLEATFGDFVKPILTHLSLMATEEDFFTILKEISSCARGQYRHWLDRSGFNCFKIMGEATGIVASNSNQKKQKE